MVFQTPTLFMLSLGEAYDGDWEIDQIIEMNFINSKIF